MNTHSENICRINLQNFILQISISKEINKYSYEECYRLYYNLSIKNNKKILNEWFVDLINSLKRQDKIIFNILVISDILLYMLNQNMQYQNVVLDKKKFISLLNNINDNIIKKRIYFIYLTDKILCKDILQKILLEY